jgi:hypothetical protein
MAVLQIKDGQGNWVSIPAIQGPEGPQGPVGPAPDLSNYATKDYVEDAISDAITDALGGSY